MKQGVFKYIFVLSFIILLIITYVVFYSKEDSKSEVQDKVSTKSTLITNLRLGIAELDTLNPVLTNNKNVKEISRLIFDPLLIVKDDYGLEFVLASGIAKEDNLKYIITLRNDVKWHDGTSFTSQDVKFTIDTIKNSNCSYSTNLKYIDDLEIVDENTVKITLSREVEFFEYNLTMPILSSNYFNGENVASTEKNNSPMGTGMFKFSSYENGLVKLVPNENYWNTQKKPLLTEIDVNIYDSVGNMYAAFKSGYIDIMEVDSKNIQTYIGSLGYTKVDIPERDVTFLSFNTGFDVLSDSRTRKAIALYIDKANLMANIGSGYLQTNFLLPSNNWFYDTKLDTVYLENQTADGLLTEAGWVYQNNRWVNSEGRVLTFSITVNGNYPDRVSSAYVIASQLANHGIEVTVNEQTSEGFENAYNNKAYESMIIGIHTGFSPKVTSLFGNDNLANYQSENLTNIINEIKNTTDYSKQKTNYNNLYDEYLNSFPYVFLYRNTSSVVYNQTLCGKISPNSYSMFYNVEKWYRQ